MQRNIDEHLYALMYRCSFLLQRSASSALPLPPGQLRVLAVIRQCACHTQRELLEQTGVRAASLSAMLSKLEAGGYITRTRDDTDKRTVQLSLTALGNKTIDENLQKQQKMAEDAFSMLDTDEKQKLMHILQPLLDAWTDKF